jgi:antitoxin component YwqK of YwqJK toxin-antitoxin module
MKKVFLSIFILLPGINYVYSQVPDTLYFDKNWNPTGHNNYSFYRITTKDSHAVKCIDYYKNGEIQSTGTYIDSNLVDKIGPFYYYKNNRLTSIQVYKASHYPEFLESLDRIISRVPPQMDSLMLEINYNKSEAIESIGYRNDFCNKVGTWLSYWQKGKYVYLETYTNGVLDGPWSVYHLDKIFRTGFRNAGKKHGDWNYYDKSGQLYKKIQYQDGKKIKSIRYEVDQNLQPDLRE